mgnify:CR=1 FL=1
MRIQNLTLPVSDPDSVARYFRDALQLPVHEYQVVIGWSTITLAPADGRPVGGVHLAFNVPDNRFVEAMAWLRARTPLQRSPDGKDYFALESSWQSQSVYFTGPDGLILELIGRRRLPVSAREGAFHGSELTCLSEVGLPSHDLHVHSLNYPASVTDDTAMERSTPALVRHGSLFKRSAQGFSFAWNDGENLTTDKQSDLAVLERGLISHTVFDFGATAPL